MDETTEKIGRGYKPGEEEWGKGGLQSWPEGKWKDCHCSSGFFKIYF